MAIKLEQVSYAYGRGVNKVLGLKNLDLHIEEGCFVAIVGTSGSGKSTLLQHFNGLLQPTEGKLRILDYEIAAGEECKKWSKLRQRVGLVFQFPEQQLFEETIEEDICFGPKNFGSTKEEITEAIQRVVAQLEIDPEVLLKNRFQVSGGQIRKAAIATVLVMNPDILVLDEPTASLDQKSATKILKHLHYLCKEEGKTIILVTHRLDEVLPYADKYIVMKEGKVAFQGRKEQLVEDTTSIDEAGFSLPPAIRLMRELSLLFRLDRSPKLFNVDEMSNYICSKLLAKKWEKK